MTDRTDVPRLGVAFLPDWPPEQIRPMALACEEHGLDLWFWEDCFKESGIAAAVAALSWTSSLRAGLALMPAPLRNVALAAMEVATVARMFPGRFVPGVGHGVQSWMGQTGARVESPLTLLEEYATAMHRLLDGESVSTSGRYVNLTDVQLDHPPTGEADVSVWVGGQGPKTLQLAGRMAGELRGGILVDNAAFEKWPELRGHLGLGEEPAQGDPGIYVQVLTLAGPDAAARLESMDSAWNPGKEPGTVAVGGAEEIAAVFRRHVEFGATDVVAVPSPEESDPLELVRFLGQEVGPLLERG